MHRLSVVAVLVAAGLAACQTTPEPISGYLSDYEGIATAPAMGPAVQRRRDETLARTVERLYVEPAVLVRGAAEGLSEDEVAMVLGEVDRQVCYELSERFTVLAEPEAGIATVRAAVTRIRPTDQAGSVGAAAINRFIPGPIGVRMPGSTGFLAAEAELVLSDGRQAASLLWARRTQVIGGDKPSLSRVGDALQFAEEFGDATGDAFAPSDRRVRAIQSPDPCARFGPRNNPAGIVTRIVTGLYVPQTQNVRARQPTQQELRIVEPRP